METLPFFPALDSVFTPHPKLTSFVTSKILEKVTVQTCHCHQSCSCIQVRFDNVSVVCTFVAVHLCSISLPAMESEHKLN